MTASMIFGLPRQILQSIVALWCRNAFGDAHAKSVEERGLRLLEEAAEAAQAAGVDEVTATHVIQHVFSKPKGALYQELGGVSVTALALAETAGMQLDQAEADEIARVIAKPLEHFRARNEAKRHAGLKAKEA